jgi:DNA repair exonuclease SbcCD ATPase subunit
MQELEGKIGKIKERLDKLAQSPVFGSVETLEKNEEAKRDKAAKELDEIQEKLRALEKRDSVTLDQVYGGLREVDKVKRAIYPYAEEKNENLLMDQLKEMERKVSNISAFLATNQEAFKKMDARVQAVEKKMEAVESVVGRIDFPIDQLRNLFSLLLDTNTQMRELEVELLSIMKRTRKVENEVRELRFGVGGTPNSGSEPLQ